MISTFTLNAAVDRTYHVEGLSPGSVNRIELVKVRPGGKGINVAVIAHAIGTQEIVVSGFAGGSSGEFIDSSLKAMGIRSDFVWISGDSRSCHSFVQRNPYVCTEMNELGPEVGAADIHAMMVKAQQIAGYSDICVISGSLPKGCSPHDCARLVDICKCAGAFVILDSSGAALREALCSCPDIVKPNLEELSQLTGTDLRSEEDVIDAVVSVSSRWQLPMVVATLGSSGAIVQAQGSLYRVVVPKVNVRNTVGCGDAFVAGLCVGRDRRSPTKRWIQFATAVSLAKAVQADAGSVDPDDIEPFGSQVCVTEL